MEHALRTKVVLWTQAVETKAFQFHFSLSSPWEKSRIQHSFPQLVGKLCNLFGISFLRSSLFPCRAARAFYLTEPSSFILLSYNVWLRDYMIIMIMASFGRSWIGLDSKAFLKTSFFSEVAESRKRWSKSCASCIRKNVFAKMIVHF